MRGSGGQSLAESPSPRGGGVRPAQHPGIPRRAILAALVAGLAALGCEARFEVVVPPTPSPAPPGVPTPTPVPPTSTPAPRVDPFLSLVRPFVAAATERRAQRQADADYAARIDPDLNLDRINFFLLGYGRTYEPPYQDQIGSPTVLSLDLTTRRIDLISLTHDLRAPEIERYQKACGFRPDPTKVDRAYWLGGFDLARLVMEDATGFSIDFQSVMDDRSVRAFVDQVMGGLEIDLPFDLDTLAYISEPDDGSRDHAELQPEAHFARGPNHMNGTRVLQFMKALSKVHDPDTERNVRKRLVFQAMFAYVQQHATDPLFWLKSVDVANHEIGNGRLRADFDLPAMVAGNVSGLARGLFTFARGDGREGLMPTIGRSLYVVDRDSGDGGVEWANLSPNPIARRDVNQGVYPNPFFAIPFSSDPYAPDLPAGYWWSVRRLIKGAVLGRPLSGNEARKEAAQVNDDK